MNLLLTQDKTMRYCSIACLVSVIGLLTIWVLPNTIAFRHLLLGIGGIAAVLCAHAPLSRARARAMIRDAIRKTLEGTREREIRAFSTSKHMCLVPGEARGR